MSKSRIPWQDFEREVADQLEKEIRSNQTSFNPKQLRAVRRKRRYYSKEREAHIEFDVVAEFFEPGATRPSLRWIIECKDYPNHRVTVGDVEEFARKVQQVGPGNTRASVVTRVGFQSSARTFAVTNRIGLYTLGKRLKKVTCFAAENEGYDKVIFPCEAGVFPDGRDAGPGDWTFAMIVQVELRMAGVIPPI